MKMIAVHTIVMAKDTKVLPGEVYDFPQETLDHLPEGAVRPVPNTVEVPPAAPAPKKKKAKAKPKAKVEEKKEEVKEEPEVGSESDSESLDSILD